MPPTPLPLGVPVPRSAQVNARIRALMQGARGRRLQPAERAEYQRLLAEWTVATRAEQAAATRGQWVPVA